MDLSPFLAKMVINLEETGVAIIWDLETEQGKNGEKVIFYLSNMGENLLSALFLCILVLKIKTNDFQMS